MIQIFDLSCRLCLKKCSNNDITPTTISEDYTKYTGFKIRDFDIPQKVCQGCVKDLEQFISTFERWNQNEAILEEYQLNSGLYDVKLENEEIDYQPGIIVTEIYQPEIEPPPPPSPPTEMKTSKAQKQKSRRRRTKKVICEVCGIEVAPKMLWRHMEVHEQADQQFICDLCPSSKSFQSRYQIHRHMRYTHLAKDKKQKYACELCDKLFNNLTSKRAHHFRHHVDPQDYQFGCLICGRRFFRKTLLKVHNRSHTGEKLYSCDICQAKFSLPQHVRVHKRNIHNRETVICTYCGKTFNSQKYLQQHTMIHTQTDYVCPLCPDKKFSFTTTLRSHMKTNHPLFPMPPPGTRLKNYTWENELRQTRYTADVKAIIKN